MLSVKSKIYVKDGIMVPLDNKTIVFSIKQLMVNWVVFHVSHNLTIQHLKEKNEYRWPYVDTSLLRDCQTKPGAELNERISTTFTAQKYPGLTKKRLLMAFESDKGSKSISTSAVFL